MKTTPPTKTKLLESLYADVHQLAEAVDIAWNLSEKTGMIRMADAVFVERLAAKALRSARTWEKAYERKKHQRKGKR